LIIVISQKQSWFCISQNCKLIVVSYVYHAAKVRIIEGENKKAQQQIMPLNNCLKWTIDTPILFQNVVLISSKTPHGIYDGLSVRTVRLQPEFLGLIYLQLRVLVF
jgi:hypothetical protein